MATNPKEAPAPRPEGMHRSTAIVGMIICGVLGYFLGMVTTQKNAPGVPTTPGEDTTAGAPGDADKGLDPSKVVFKVPDGTSPVKGPKFAKVTLIEFSDFQ